MSLLSDDSGIAYGLVYIMVGVISIGIVWITLGVIVDELVIVSQDSTITIYNAKTTAAITDLNKIWDLILWVPVGCGFLYGIVTAIRKERGGLINN